MEISVVQQLAVSKKQNKSGRLKKSGGAGRRGQQAFFCIIKQKLEVRL